MAPPPQPAEPPPTCCPRMGPPHPLPAAPPPPYLLPPQVFSGELNWSAVIKKMTSRRFRLRLVCEYCMRPSGDGYLVDRPETFVAKLLPALQVGGRGGRPGCCSQPWAGGRGGRPGCWVS